jgi:L-ribulose-5-phosphate 4-epimerase
MSYERLQERVCAANRQINRAQLAILNWGNASEVDRPAGVFAIKPSGVDYEALTPADIPVISLETGKIIQGAMKPSSDTATHWQLYQDMPQAGGIVHSHSPFATAWAQAQSPIPCLGTTHADTFHGPVPCTRPLTRTEVEGEYERNTGKVIVEHFTSAELDPAAVPGVLVAGHGPFVWSKDAMQAVTTASILEEVARMATMTLQIRPDTGALAQFLLHKHYQRKHGTNAYYGQKGNIS